jgi:hypothetical protein
MFLVRRVADGTMRTVVAYSHRNAMELFRANYHPPPGEDYEIKERKADDEWVVYRVTK